jgi:hypothetical protein
MITSTWSSAHLVKNVFSPIPGMAAQKICSKATLGNPIAVRSFYPKMPET